MLTALRYGVGFFFLLRVNKALKFYTHACTILAYKLGIP